MSGFIFEFLGDNPKLIAAILALMVSTYGVSLTLSIRRKNFYEKLEADSLSQIEQNHKDIERILNKTVVVSAGETVSLQDIVDGIARDIDFSHFGHQLQSLARYFSEYCANLDKYNSNIMLRKKVCMRFQEHGRYARRLQTLFEKAGYSDIGVEFSKLHLRQAGIVERDSE